MRYYLYRDINLLKEIYSQFISLRFDLDVIERIDAKSNFEENGVFVEPEMKINDKCDSRARLGVRNNNSTNITTISEYANMEDIKEIYNKRFYHNLIDCLFKKQIKAPGVCIVQGKMCCMRNEGEGLDKFVYVDDICIWFEDDKMSNDIKVMEKITDEICVIGCTIKEKNGDSPKVIKAIAIYVDI